MSSEYSVSNYEPIMNSLEIGLSSVLGITPKLGFFYDYLLFERFSMISAS
jgi:hypothetical protein